MNSELLDTIIKMAVHYGCEYKTDERLSKYTTFGIGGKCPLVIEANENTIVEIVPFMQKNNVPFYILGKGSNMIISDSDIDRVFIHIGRGMADISVSDNMIYCGSGASLASVCCEARDNSLTGLEFAYGIPGSVGGAVFMNAGAYGGEMKMVIDHVFAADFFGNTRRFERDDLDLSYRHSIFYDRKYIVTRVVFRLEYGDRAAIDRQMQELTEKRREKQPLEYRSAGSTFKRPAGAYAGVLIEQCGLKGYAVGDAEVSTKHAGFVVNKGNATYDDLMAVIDHVKRVVYEKTGYSLECEPETVTE